MSFANILKLSENYKKKLFILGWGKHHQQTISNINTTEMKPPLSIFRYLENILFFLSRMASRERSSVPTLQRCSFKSLLAWYPWKSRRHSQTIPDLPFPPRSRPLAGVQLCKAARRQSIKRVGPERTKAASIHLLRTIPTEIGQHPWPCT